MVIDPLMLLAFQTVGLVMFLVSMAFRMKGNYLVHGIIMIVLVAIGWFSVVMTIPNFLDSSFMEPYMSPSLTFAAFSLHSIFGIAAIVFATWLVALWRPRSTDFVVKSKRIWQLTVVFWVFLTYVVGVLLYVALTATSL